jgi:hypothetical protein
LSIDVATFVLRLVLLFVHILTPPRRGEQRKEHITRGVVWFQYIFARRACWGYNSSSSLAICAWIALLSLAPMVLLRTRQRASNSGSRPVCEAIGTVVGGVLMAWGGFRRRVHGVLAGWIVSSFFFALWGWAPLQLWVGSQSLYSFGSTDQWLRSSNLAIQSRPDVRNAFSCGLIAWMTNPISPLSAGPLADYVLAPAMRLPSGLSSIFGWLVPPGPGAGMGLLIFFSSLGGILAGLVGYFVAAIRDAEDILPDHDVSLVAESVRG